MYRFLIFILALSLPAVFASAQPDRSDVRKGNRDFRKEDWKEAEIDYRKALVKDSTSLAANYNLANTLYKMGDYGQAAKGYSALKDVAPASDIASDWYYNTGNASAQTKDWQAAVEAYRQSLLLNPGDMDAKENYIYAKKMLQNQQQNQNQDQNKDQNQDQNKDQNQDQNKDQNQDQNNQNQDQNKDQNQDQNKDQNQNNNQDQNQQGQNSQQPKITPQAAQQMLQAIQAKEKETQEKVKKEKAEALKSRQKEKNW
ncbi:MAG: tetratricopeptide repeat protein [Bacteroidetes bacterium]|uniref:Tetratricopeptide repeat protein n=1 Tax=Candidatus Cryptobacteroides intestinigallinarum TaxID=2840767 RepID=A0A9D9HME6_9BACT|nr:tetratricopeptide repeat protein [Candidatus Cryptobacteroides intestinigallinarum]